jgi:hypothetical protein
MRQADQTSRQDATLAVRDENALRCCLRQSFGAARTGWRGAQVPALQTAKLMSENDGQKSACVLDYCALREKITFARVRNAPGWVRL